MDSNKSRVKRERSAVEPRRRPGKERVAALLAAAAAVIAERGYEAATMTEIAARAGALVGSLYHFFPNKEAVGEALIRRFEGILDEAFDAIDARAGSMSSGDLADALLDLMLDIRGESKALVPLLEAREEWSAKGRDLLDRMLRRIAATLTIRSPGLDPEAARSLAVVVLQNMKAVKALTADDAPAAAEMRAMTRLYLESRLPDHG
ncbi:TetR/AcrR family transcriptional regulator [Paludisphaera mucosa]|uniref:Helix-turn-helix domain containing protein n=1 Tax=Paludisphaera mucosa TaxID=3030827 RepID=A0ABT6FJX2_9BACT|nr:TetR/AcrR family transcriptional regulator [Paludisphaera mucosa]MDG3007849.1 helix-turn-helix domain containing protein [Paludisphaera mucosa]